MNKSGQTNLNHPNGETAVAHQPRVGGAAMKEPHPACTPRVCCIIIDSVFGILDDEATVRKCAEQPKATAMARPRYVPWGRFYPYEPDQWLFRVSKPVTIFREGYSGKLGGRKLA